MIIRKGRPEMWFKRKILLTCSNCDCQFTTRANKCTNAVFHSVNFKLNGVTYYKRTLNASTTMCPWCNKEILFIEPEKVLKYTREDGSYTINNPEEIEELVSEARLHQYN